MAISLIWKGDHRELDASAAQHLVVLGVLKKTDREASPPPVDPVAAFATEADRRIAALRDSVKAAEAAAADQMGALDKRVEDARAQAEKAMQELVDRIAAKEAELQELEKRADAAKAEPPPSNKAEGKAPANKADKA